MQEEKQLKDIINTKGIVIYFYNTTCSSCKVLRPKVRDMINQSFPGIEFREINVEEYPEITASASVYTAPVIIVYFEGKETLRESRYISLTQLEEKIKRYYSMLF